MQDNEIYQNIIGEPVPARSDDEEQGREESSQSLAQLITRTAVFSEDAPEMEEPDEIEENSQDEAEESSDDKETEERPGPVTDDEDKQSHSKTGSSDERLQYQIDKDGSITLESDLVDDEEADGEPAELTLEQKHKTTGNIEDVEKKNVPDASETYDDQIPGIEKKDKRVPEKREWANNPYRELTDHYRESSEYITEDVLISEDQTGIQEEENHAARKADPVHSRRPEARWKPETGTDAPELARETDVRAGVEETGHKWVDSVDEVSTDDPQKDYSHLKRQSTNFEYERTIGAYEYRESGRGQVRHDQTAYIERKETGTRLPENAKEHPVIDKMPDAEELFGKTHIVDGVKLIEDDAAFSGGSRSALNQSWTASRIIHKADEPNTYQTDAAERYSGNGYHEINTVKKGPRGSGKGTGQPGKTLHLKERFGSENQHKVTARRPLQSLVENTPSKGLIDKKERSPFRKGKPSVLAGGDISDTSPETTVEGNEIKANTEKAWKRAPSQKVSESAGIIYKDNTKLKKDTAGLLGKRANTTASVLNIRKAEKVREQREASHTIKTPGAGTVTIGKAGTLSEKNEDTVSRRGKGLVDVESTPGTVKGKEGTALRTDDGLLETGKKKGKGTLGEQVQKARESFRKLRRHKAMTSVATDTTQAAAPQQIAFTAKIKAAAKVAAKKILAGSIAGTLAASSLAGGYIAATNDSASMWYPIQSHVTVDGSDNGTPLTQDAADKMFTRLSAYGINTSYEAAGSAGPLTIHIPGYEMGSSDIRWGDSQIILTGNGSCLLLDGGCGILSDMTLEYLSQKGVTQLSAIITHWHGDHYTGLARILAAGSIHVDTLYCPPPDDILGYDSAEAYAGKRICDAVEAQGGHVTHPEADHTTNFNLFGLNIEIWRKTARGVRNADTSVNDGSMQVYFPDLYYLTTGDIIYSLPEYLTTMTGRTIKLFQIPHHGNGSRIAMPMFKTFGAEACWYNNVEPGGNTDASGFSVGAQAAEEAGYTVFKTLGDLEITAGGGQVTVSGNGKYYSYPCPYNPEGVSGGNTDLVTYARKWIGKVPYKSSVTGNDPDNERSKPLAAGRGSDCSWFVFHCLEQFGLLEEFVHSYEWGTEPDKYPGGTNTGTDISKAVPGDILCYAYGASKNGGERKGSNSHVAIYAGDGKQIECAAGAGGVVESGVDNKNLIQIVHFGTAASSSASYVNYSGTDSQTRYGFTPETEAIVEAHMNEFNYNTFDSFMRSKGGSGNYIRSLGGVFAKYYGRDVSVQTAGEFQEVAEYVMGIYTIWGPDYNGGGGIHKFNSNWGSGNQNGRFYAGQGDNHRWWTTTPIEQTFVNDREKVMTDCGCGIYHIMQKAGLMNSYAGMGTIGNAERYLSSHNCYSQGGKIVTRKEDLQVGDLVQMIKREDHTWHHVAVVGEIKADGKIILYDTGNRYVNSANYKKEFISDSAGLHGDYEGYESWFGVRVKQLAQTGGITSGMATQDLKDIRIASVKVDGNTIDKSGFKFSNLREYSSGEKNTSSVTVKYRFVDEKGEEIKAGSDVTAGTSSPASYSGAASASGTVIDVPDGLGSIHTYMGWQCITSTTSNQYRLRQEAGENYDSEGFAIIDGRYVIACTTTFGKVGDYVDFYKEDGLVLHCIIGDIKSSGDAGCTKWGHHDGKNVIEFVVDKSRWYSGGNGSHANPGTSSCHPEWATEVTKAVNLGQRTGGASLTMTAATQGEYDAQALLLVKQILGMSVAGSYYKNPVSVNDYDWYCFDLLDYAVCDYHGADVEYTTGDGDMTCTATVTICCSLPELEKADKNFKSWEYHLVGGDYFPKSYMSLSKIDYEEVFNVDFSVRQKLNQVVFSGTEQDVYSFFLAKGLGAAQIAGIMANIKAESGFNPKAQNKSGASGLFQWMGGRLKALKELAESKGKDWTDLQTQLEYAWIEIDGNGWNGHTAEKKQFMTTTSASQAAALFCNYFERCGIAEQAVIRGKDAEKYYSQIMAAGGSNINYVQWAITTANDDSHGYSQASRTGNPDYDCSSFVFYSLKNAGYDVGSSPFTTYTMGPVLERIGFRRISISSYSDLQPGDILWKTDHTEIYIGNNKRVGAHSSYGHSQSGDQGGEVSVKDMNDGWHYVYRRS